MCLLSTQFRTITVLIAGDGDGDKDVAGRLLQCVMRGIGSVICRKVSSLLLAGLPSTEAG